MTAKYSEQHFSTSVVADYNLLLFYCLMHNVCNCSLRSDTKKCQNKETTKRNHESNILSTIWLHKKRPLKCELRISWQDEFIMIIMSIMYVELQGTDALDYLWKMVKAVLATCTCTNLLFWTRNRALTILFASWERHDYGHFTYRLISYKM